MPPATLVAYKHHGSPELRIDRNVDDARRVMDQLADVGIGMNAVTKRLEDEGVAAFAKSFDTLIATVERRRHDALGSRSEDSASSQAKPEKRAPRKTKPVRRAAAKKKPATRAASKKPRRAAAKPRKKAPARAARKAGRKTVRRSAKKKASAARRKRGR
jgi:hypothetical protein